MNLDPTGWASLLSPVGCVIFLFVALTRGWLVSGREMDRHEQIWEARLKESDERIKESHERELVWQKAAETSEETRRDVADQLRMRQIVDEAVVRAIGALPHVNTPEGT